MIEKNEQEYWLDLDLFLIAMVVAALGGLVSYFQKNKALRKTIDKRHLLIFTMGALFSGVLAFLLSQLFVVWWEVRAGKELLTLVAVAVIGHFNNDGINILKFVFYSILKAKFPSIDLSEAEKAAKKEKD